MKDLAEIIKYAEQYKDNRSYHIVYKKAKNPDAYFRRYESQIILYGGARRMLEQAGIKLKGLNVDKLRAEYQALETHKKELTATYKNYEKEVRDLKRKQENLDQYLGRTQTDPVQEQQTKIKNHSSQRAAGELLLLLSIQNFAGNSNIFPKYRYKAKSPGNPEDFFILPCY